MSMQSYAMHYRTLGIRNLFTSRKFWQAMVEKNRFLGAADIILDYFDDN